MFFIRIDTCTIVLLSAIVLAAAVSGCDVVGSDERHPTAVFATGCTTIVNQPVDLMNRSTNAVAYTWTFGDGRTSTEASPTIVYAQEGEYDVTLVARNGSGAIDSMTRRLRVHPTPPARKTIALNTSAAEPGSPWATAVSVVLSAYGVNIAPCEIDSRYVGGNCCVSSAECDPWVSRNILVSALEIHGGLIANDELGAMSLDELRFEIAQGRPVILWYNGNDLYRTLVAYGYDGGNNISVVDPTGQYSVMAFDELERYPVELDHLEWTGSIQCIRRAD